MILAITRLLVTAILSGVVTSFATASSFDAGFGMAGRALVPLPGPNNAFMRNSGIARDAHDRIVVFASFEGGVGAQAIRLTVDGALDPAFGSAGRVNLDLTDAGLPSEGLTAVGIGPASDGGYWLVGNQGTDQGFLVRLDDAGRQIPITPFATGRAERLDGTAAHLAVDSTGRAWIVQFAREADVIVVERRTPEGLRDPAFGSGIATIDIPRASRSDPRIDPLPGGGAFLYARVAGQPAAALKLEDGGARDIAFGDAGSTRRPVSSLAPSGTGFVTVERLPVAAERWSVRRIDARGDDVPAFPAVELVSDDAFMTDEPLVLVDAAGRIVVAGPVDARPSPGNNVRSDIGIHRLRADGSPDAGFGSGGFLRVHFDDPLGIGRAGGYTGLHLLVADSQRRLVVAGQHFFEDVPSGTPVIGEIAVARLAAPAIFEDGFEGPPVR